MTEESVVDPAPPQEQAPAADAAAAAPPEAAADKPAEPAEEPLRSVHTGNFPGLLNQLGISLLVTTYQAGKLIVVRTQEGKLNTHFRTFQQPMGLAANQHRICLGTKYNVIDLRNQPDVCKKLDPPDAHDACYLPRAAHFTGDIRIHEIAWGGNELWIVNTRFSCLCTLDHEHSFVPRWRPPFVTALSPEDRCHLNGLAIVDGRPKYVTCLGETDTAGGWRQNKRDGGMLLNVDTGKILLRGLSMPHSPRKYNDKLWLLESGEGSLARVNLQAGKLETVTKLPGFTRGLDFCGPLAFIGLSQVRETATFSGLPLTDRLEERTCGVWVVDLRDGRTVAFLRFEAAVQEIFAVQVLHGVRYPDIIHDNEELVGNSFVLPTAALRDVPRHKNL